jgi:hypothetical protein
MKRKASELDGALLDAAVAKAEGMAFEIAVGVLWTDGGTSGGGFRPSQDWRDGGPIIEREHIDVNSELNDTVQRSGPEEWWAEMLHDARDDGVQRSYGHGPTPLIAAMRAYVASKFGDEIELPE